MSEYEPLHKQLRMQSPSSDKNADSVDKEDDEDDDEEVNKFTVEMLEPYVNRTNQIDPMDEFLGDPTEFEWDNLLDYRWRILLPELNPVYLTKTSIERCVLFDSFLPNDLIMICSKLVCNWGDFMFTNLTRLPGNPREYPLNLIDILISKKLGNDSLKDELKDCRKSAQFDIELLNVETQSMDLMTRVKRFRYLGEGTDEELVRAVENRNMDRDRDAVNYILAVHSQMKDLYNLTNHPAFYVWDAMFAAVHHIQNEEERDRWNLN
jgi:hypothetical protein